MFQTQVASDNILRKTHKFNGLFMIILGRKTLNPPKTFPYFSHELICLSFSPGKMGKNVSNSELVGGIPTPLKNMSQLGSLFPIFPRRSMYGIFTYIDP